jgi:hypothetical protein
MREDMSKVIVERPRPGSGRRDLKHGRFKNLDFDDMPSHEGMRASRRRLDTRNFNENLSPLRRFLQSRVGRRWDDVYSEICQNLDRSSTVQDHVFTHIDDYVERHLDVDAEGRLFVHRAGSWRVDGERHFTEPFYGPFGLHVDPRDGILKLDKDEVTFRQRFWFGRAAYRPGAAAPETKVHYVDGKELELRRIDGVWYWVTWDTVPPAYNVPVYDERGELLRMERREHFRNEEFTGHRVRSGERYRSGKRQASGRDLKKYGLSNCPNWAYRPGDSYRPSRRTA